MKRLISLLIAIVLLAPTAFAEESTFESLILDVIKKNPQVIKEALEKYEKEAAEKDKEQEFDKLFADRAEVEIGNSPVRGDKKAEYTIIAFSDFQCPFCKRGDDTIKEVMKKYDKKVKYVFKNFPLSFHPEAAPAAKAVWAAGKQGKFFEYHDKLFENQQKLGDELFVQLAKDLSLNIDKFNKDRASDEAQKSIDADMKAGQAVGIQGTPGFILNGIKILGAYPVEHFDKVILRLETTAKK